MPVLLEPPFEQWHDILRANYARRDEIAVALGGDRIKAIQKSVVREASEYARTLASVAKEVGVSLGIHSSAGYQPETPIVMAGHQPTIYHSGLFFKAKMLSRIAREERALGILVDIDTDVGDAGKLVWPRLVDGRIELVSASLTSSGSSEMYRSQHLANTSRIDDVFRQMGEDLIAAGLRDEARRAAQVGQVYRALEGRPLAIANAVVRARYEQPGYLEVPLSRLLQCTELGALIHEIAQDARRFASTYNACLDTYRKEHKIKNQANPFPNVKSVNEEQELPLWRVSESGRVPVLCRSNGRIDLQPGEFIASRGSVTTMLLRGYCSDLFIHGLGGANYDRFVDFFSSHYLNVILPRFVVASETRYLFADQVAKTKRLLELASQYKDIISKTEKFLGKDIFTETEEAALKPLLEKRRELRAALGITTEERGHSALSHALNECNRQVRSIIESTVVHSCAQQAPALQRELERWSFREFPFFLFD